MRTKPARVPPRPVTRLLEVVEDMLRNGSTEHDIAHALGFVSWFTGLVGLPEFGEGAKEGAQSADESVRAGKRCTYT